MPKKSLKNESLEMKCNGCCEKKNIRFISFRSRGNGDSSDNKGSEPYQECIVFYDEKLITFDLLVNREISAFAGGGCNFYSVDGQPDAPFKLESIIEKSITLNGEKVDEKEYHQQIDSLKGIIEQMAKCYKHNQFKGDSLEFQGNGARNTSGKSNGDMIDYHSKEKFIREHYIKSRKFNNGGTAVARMISKGQNFIYDEGLFDEHPYEMITENHISKNRGIIPVDPSLEKKIKEFNNDPIIPFSQCEVPINIHYADKNYTIIPVGTSFFWYEGHPKVDECGRLIKGLEQNEGFPENIVYLNLNQTKMPQKK